MIATSIAMLKSRILLPMVKHSQSSLLHITHTKFKSNYKEIKIPVPWGHVAGRWWGRTDLRPVLALHGWQDNCGSFNRLIPLLNKDVSFLAIDFPGHGFSSSLPSGLYYHFFNYVILVQYLVNYFNWPKVSLIGHSMGGIVSFLYTSIHPKNVDFVICIEFFKPFILNNNIARMAKDIIQFQKFAAFEKTRKEPPSYTMHEIKKRVCASNNDSIAYEHSDHVVERNVAPSKSSEGKYILTRDPRLKVMN